jgi:uncharacterized protein
VQNDPRAKLNAQSMIQHFLYTTERGHRTALSLYGAHLPADAPTVLYLHGFKGFKDWGFVPYLGQRMMENGIRLLAMNFSHNGIGEDLLAFTELQKFKENTFSLEVEEAQEVLEKYCLGEIFSGNPRAVGVIGHSRGGGIALLAFAAHLKVKGICTWASVSTFARYPEAILREWKAKGFLEVTNARTGQVMQLGYQLHEDLMAKMETTLDVRQAVMNCTKPLCFIHGEADEAVSSADARALFEWAENTSAELHLIPGAGHTFGAKHPFEGTTPHLEDVLAHTLSFFKKQLN